jgi:hypothetical protein
MMSKHRIAILISLMLAMPAAVVAVEQVAMSAVEAQTESAVQPVAMSSEQIVGTAPIGGAIRAKPSDTFPKGEIDTEWERLPAAVAYLDRLEQQRGYLIARGDAFPMGTQGDNYYDSLPAQVAYFGGTPVASAQVETPAPVAKIGNALRSATDYVAGLFKSNRSSAPAESTAAGQ